MPKKYKISSRPQKNGTYKITYLKDMVGSGIKATNYFYVFSHRILSQLGSSYCHNVIVPTQQRGMCFGDISGGKQGKLVLENKACIYKATKFPNKLFRFARS